MTQMITTVGQGKHTFYGYDVVITRVFNHNNELMSRELAEAMDDWTHALAERIMGNINAMVTRGNPWPSNAQMSENVSDLLEDQLDRFLMWRSVHRGRVITTVFNHASGTSKSNIKVLCSSTGVLELEHNVTISWEPVLKKASITLKDVTL